MTDWDERFINLSITIADWSKDRSRHVGCILVGAHKEILATGYNGFPRGINDDVEERHQRPAKYQWTEHAERNAVYNAARIGVPLMGATAYIAWFPCIDCARALIQAGIKKLVCYMPDLSDPKFGEEFRIGMGMLTEAGMEVKYVSGECPKQK